MNNNNTPTPRYCSIQDVCIITGLSQATIYRLLADHRLRALKAGSKTLVDLRSVDAFLEALPAIGAGAKLAA
jgi:excisionase family DNA binding protein